MRGSRKPGHECGGDEGQDEEHDPIGLEDYGYLLGPEDPLDDNDSNNKDEDGASNDDAVEDPESDVEQDGENNTNANTFHDKHNWTIDDDYARYDFAPY